MAATMVLDNINDIEIDETEEFADIGSFNHGYLMVRMGMLFDRLVHCLRSIDGYLSF